VCVWTSDITAVFLSALFRRGAGFSVMLVLCLISLGQWVPTEAEVPCFLWDLSLGLFWPSRRTRHLGSRVEMRIFFFVFGPHAFGLVVEMRLCLGFFFRIFSLATFFFCKRCDLWC